jgi:tetratricopeptide (TPR) repeat protein
MRSPVLGNYFLSGIVVDGELRADLRRDSAAAPTGTLRAVGAASRTPLRDYAKLEAAIRAVITDRLYNPALLQSSVWQTFLDNLSTRMASAQDDLDAQAVFYGLKSKLGTSHFELLRDPRRAELPLDSMLGNARPDALVNLSFPVPGIARLHIARWNRVAGPVHRAFERIDSARVHTLILDVRGNPGGDATSMSPAQHLFREPINGGVFLANRWYAAHPGPPSPAELNDLPVLDDLSSPLSRILNLLNERGALVGRVQPAAPYFGGTVYVLADGRTGSASEPLVHLLKTSGRATVVGAKTAGAVLTAPAHPVGDGWLLVLPVADFYTGDGIRLEGVGVTPDIAVASADAIGAVARRLEQTDRYAAAMLAGLAHFEAQRRGDAEKSYQEASRLQPDSIAPLYWLGRTAYEAGDWQKAFDYYGRVLNRQPNDAATIYQIGRTAAMSGRNLEAGERALRQYLTLPVLPGQPPYAAAHWRLGQIFEKRGDVTAARREYEAAVALDPLNPDYQASLRAIR